MRGLLLKDFYMSWKYCRMVLLMMLIFLGVSATGDDNMFFMIYPMMVASIVPTTLLSYDEKSGWNLYSGALPYSRAQLVSAKYLVAAVLMSAVWLVSAGIQLVREALGAPVDMQDLAFILSLLLLMGILSSGIILPVMFKYGVEKGRFTYYIMIAVVCGGGVAFPQILEKVHFTLGVQEQMIPVLMAVGAIAFFAVSWIISIKVYEKREI
ncbi:MAG: ABC-2 transporter permease [Lachnospiraceae bacterium]|nr:ABC-2 transporter permease [Lachnospiraceae bacterium]